MPSLKKLVNSKNGVKVLYDPVDSHAATHIEDTPQLRELVAEVLTKTILTDDIEFFEYDFEDVIGNTGLVSNDKGDQIVYAKRKNRDVYSPFNKSKTPNPCSVITVYIEKIDSGKYELKSTWVGFKDSPPFPGDKNETPSSEPYWRKHSLAWGTQEIQEKTLTSTCPW